MNKIKFFSILFVLFLITRILDFTVIWNLGKLEHEYIGKSNILRKMESENTEYSFLGFSSHEKAKKALTNIVESKEREDFVVIVSYFTLLTPTEYLVYNKGERKNLLLPWAHLTIDEGTTEVSFYKFEMYEINTKKTNEWHFAPFIGSVLNYFLFSNKLETSYLDISKYLNLIHIIYFVLPLIIILIFYRCFSKTIYISFWYFFIMLLLFTSRSYWTCPFIFLLEKILGYDGIPKVVHIIVLFLNVFIYYLFMKGIKIGRNLSRSLQFIEKIIIFYFLLLPIFLRF